MIESYPGIKEGWGMGSSRPEKIEGAGDPAALSHRARENPSKDRPERKGDHARPRKGWDDDAGLKILHLCGSSTGNEINREGNVAHNQDQAVRGGPEDWRHNHPRGSAQVTRQGVQVRATGQHGLPSARYTADPVAMLDYIQRICTKDKTSRQDRKRTSPSCLQLLTKGQTSHPTSH